MNLRSNRVAGIALMLAALVAGGCTTQGAVSAAGLRPNLPANVKPRLESLAPHTITPRVSGPISLGPGGMVVLPDAASQWVSSHGTDTRTPLIKSRISGKPTSLWLTGTESYGNLQYAVKTAKAQDGTLTLTLWNIPLRYDGLSELSQVTLTQYQDFITKVASTLGTTRAIVVLEPDSLWFYDRMPTAASQTIRMQAMNFAMTRLAKYAVNTRVYIDAGTSSGSVTPERMAGLLDAANFKRASGFAVNVSSYAPSPAIEAYAQKIRAALQKRGFADPRYVIDSGRNGARSWDNNWCNPSTQRLGAAPAVVQATTGLDMYLWIKAPGTSDGDCGVGPGSYGGQFLPAMAYKMITG